MRQGGVGVLVRRDSFCHLTRNPIFSLLGEGCEAESGEVGGDDVVLLGEDGD